MFAFFGLGIAELIVLAIIGILIAAVTMFVIRASSRPSASTAQENELMELRAEVKRLRDEVARLREGNKKGPPGAIAAGEP